MPAQRSTSSLLESLWQRLDDPYEAALTQQQPRHRHAHRLFSGLLALLLGAGMAVAIGQLRNQAPEAETARASLIAQIEESTAQAAELQERNLLLGEQVAEERAASLSDADSDLTERLQQLERRSGATELSGRGVTVTLRDDSAGPAAGDPRTETAAANRVQDQDLQTVVNALFAVGAEGITVNGHRFTSLSSIRGAGGAILINYVPLSAPYEIQAVGPGSLRADFLASDAWTYLKTLESEYSVPSSVSQQRALTLPAADIPSFSHVEPLPGSRGGPSADEESEVTE